MSSFNYRAEKSRFDFLWDRLAVEYREAGMSPEAIEEMRQFDWDEFKRRRNCCLHETLFSELEPSEESDDSDNTIPNSRLLKQMVVSDTDLALLNAYMFEGYSQVEIAKMLGVSQQAVAKKLSRLKRILKNFE